MDKLSRAICLALLLGAAAPTYADNTHDPYERYNRAMFRFNDKADQYVMSPIARGYRKVTPKPVRTAFANFFNNLRDINSFGSNILRGNIKRAGGDFMRVAVNTTFGIGGLINIADAAGMPNHKDTLGDTFASWGWKNSNYLVLPLLGPSTSRDTLGNAVHFTYSPTKALIHDVPARYTLLGIDSIDQRERLLDSTDTLNEVALDKYVLVRDAYIAVRNKKLGISTPANTEEELVDPEADWQESEAAEPRISMPNHTATQP